MCVCVFTMTRETRGQTQRRFLYHWNNRSRSKLNAKTNPSPLKTSRTVFILRFGPPSCGLYIFLFLSISAVYITVYPCC
jgi:hypothetical protein